MNTSVSGIQKHKTHPMMIIGAVAVVLFCTAGIAAIMGWIPTSIGSNPSASDVVLSDKTVVQAKQPSQSAQRVVPAQPKAVTKPVQVAAAPVAVVCTNCGVVESTRETTTAAKGSGLGAAGGAVVGGLLGNQVGGGRGKDAMTVVGAIGGAVVGNQIETRVKSTQSYEISVRMNDGSMRSIEQATQPEWRAGDRVRIVDGVIRSNA